MLIEPHANRIIAGDRFDWTPQDVIDYLEAL